MIYINGVGYADKTQAHKPTKENTNSRASFDSFFEAETVIYASPESNGTILNRSYSNQTTCPAYMEGYFQNAANTYGIDINLLKAVAKAESGFNPSVVSSAGAVGVMQLMPQTAASLGVVNSYNAEENITGGAKYLSQLLNKYNGDTSLALAAYNAGSGNVDKYGGIPPFKETQHYVNKVLNYYNNINAAGYVGVSSATDNTAETIYAVAANDATNAATIYAIPAAPKTSL